MTPPEAKANARLSRLWRDYAWRYKGDIAALAPALMLVAAAGASYGFILREAIDALGRGVASVALWAPMAVIAATSVRALAIYAQGVLSQNLALKVLRDLQSAMFRALIHADFARFATEETGSLVSRFTNDINVVTEGLVRTLQAVLRDALTLLGAFISMLFFDWVLTVFVVAVFAVAGPPLAAIAKRARAQTVTAQQQAGALVALLVESLSAARFIKTFRLEQREAERAEAAFEARRKLSMKLVRNRARSDPLLEVVGGIALAGVLGVAGWRISSGAMSLGDLLGIVTAIGVASPSARALGGFNTILSESSAALERIFGLIDEPRRVADRPNAPPLRVTEGVLEFENVGFAYGAQPALRGVSFKVKRGEVVALVGPSGAGKSTLFNLVSRLYDPTTGRVLLDGQALDAVSLASLRDNIALVAQESVLFNDTLRANIALGRPGASEADIIAAAKAAAAHDFIMALPDGYDAMAGERGATLSGGERQRIALARAFLRDAPILLLDEATSALDAESEAKVAVALKRLCAGRTTLIIAHRLSTIRDADRILVLDEGAVREEGAHAELLAQGGLYARLHGLQFTESAT